MLKSNYYHYLDADYTNDADFLFLNLCHSCNPRLNNYRLIEVQKWWDYMADIMEVNPDNSPVSIPLPEVFHMD